MSIWPDDRHWQALLRDTFFFIVNSVQLGVAFMCPDCLRWLARQSEVITHPNPSYTRRSCPLLARYTLPSLQRDTTSRVQDSWAYGRSTDGGALRVTEATNRFLPCTGQAHPAQGVDGTRFPAQPPSGQDLSGAFPRHPVGHWTSFSA